MIDELDTLSDALDGIEAPQLGLARLEQRLARRARTTRIGAGVAVAAMVGIGAAVVLARAGTTNEQQPADTLDEGALRRAGEVLVELYAPTGDATGQAVGARVPGETETRTLVSIDDLLAGASPVGARVGIGRAAWSTDGARMAFELNGDGECSSVAGLWVLDSTGPRQLTHPCGNPDAPRISSWTWVPGSATIAVAVNPLAFGPEGPTAELQLLDVAGGTARTLARIPGIIDAITPSSDGQTLLWIGGNQQSSSTLHATDIEGGATRTIIELDRVFRTLAISPDGSRVAVAGTTVRIVTMRGEVVGEAHPNRPAPYSGYDSPAWSPDGRMLAVVGELSHDGWTDLRELHLWRTDRRATEPGAIRRLDEDTGYARNVRFSPDGRTVAYLTVSDVTNWVERWKQFDVETGAPLADVDPDVAQSWTDGSTGGW